MKKIFYITIILTTLNSCGKKYDFWQLDKFNIVEGAIEDNCVVSVIYYNQGSHDDQVEEGFYRHAIVVNPNTNDTLNVLTFPDPSLSNISAENNLLVYNDHPVIENVISDIEGLLDEMKEQLKEIDPQKTTWPKYLKVTRNPEFDFIADNKYNTVIGSLSKRK